MGASVYHSVSTRHLKSDVRIYKNGVNLGIQYESGYGSVAIISFTYLDALSEGDYLQAYTRNNSGVSVTSNTTDFSPMLWIQKIN